MTKAKFMSDLYANGLGRLLRDEKSRLFAIVDVRAKAGVDLQVTIATHDGDVSLINAERIYAGEFEVIL
jgi:hypothetical protein